MSEIQVLHIIGSLERGGAEAILRNLVEHYDDSSVSHYVVTLKGMGSSCQSPQHGGLDVEVIGIGCQKNSFWGLFSLISLLTGLIKIYLIVKRVKPDVIHTWMYHSDIVGGIIGKVLGIPVLWGIFLSNLQSSYYKRSTLLIIKIVAKLSVILPTRIISCTRSGIETHVQIGYPIEKIEFVPTAIDTEFYKRCESRRETIRARENCNSTDTVIGMVARWDPQKDFELFFQSAAKLLEVRKSIKFWLAGGYGITRDNYDLNRLLDKYGISEKIRLFGNIDDIVEYYSGLDIFTLTSFGEGSPNVVCEAMSCELPCVVTDVGDIPDMLAHTGFLLDGRNSTKLVSYWLELIEHSHQYRSKVGKVARQRVIENFDKRVVNQRYIELYSSMLIH